MTMPAASPPPMPQPSATDHRARQIIPDAGDGTPVSGAQHGPGGAPSQVPWALASARPVERATARVRAKVRQLPAWDPLPPGDVDVRRPAR